ncbi:MAG TPA: SDR family NAD(P)-dependent oxidoreductase, partial [Actinophytocola sp.]|nr:SDR family NAD(P)-dependent oxidoreductase [Actinophytocola sp.]
YPELLDAALRTLTGLRAAGLAAGEPVVLHTPSLAEHLVGLWACLLGGLHPIAVAQAPDYTARNPVLDKLEHAWRDLGGPSVLSGGGTVAALRGYAERAGLDGMRVLDLAECATFPRAEEHRRAEPGDVAMLQLSSGSTGRSKIIQLTHRGIVRYAQAARAASFMRTGDVFVNWLPLDHVAGVVMYHLGPVVLGCDNVHTPTARVLADPLLWLDLLENHRAQHSWSPNFGYLLVAQAVAERPDRRWDLSCVRTLVNAGEQCTEPVMTGFVDAVRPFGITAAHLLLGWGMAETCTAISYQRFGADAVQHVGQAGPGRPLELLDAPAPGATTFLSMGPPAPGAEFRITGRDGRTELPELHIGHLQVRSDRVTPGYRNNPAANAAAFPDGDWFDTGDLAFIAGGRLTITGRAKEIIIVNGVHYYCHEIEDTLGAVDGVAASFVAAFGIPTPGGTERLAVVFVPDGRLDGALVDRLRRRLSERFGLASVLLAAVDQASFDKTTSGKIQRAGMRDRLLRGELTDALHAVELAESGPATMPDCVYRPEWTPRVFPTGPGPERVLLVGDRPELARGLPGARTAWEAGRLRALLRAAPSHLVVTFGYLDPPDLADWSTVDNLVDDMLSLAEAIAAEEWTGELVTVSRGLHRITGAEPGCYPAALAEGIGAVLGLERPGVRAWHLDLPGTEHDPELLARALTWTQHEPVVAVRDLPMVRTLRRAELVAGRASAVEPGSCWLVTGGLGGIGRAVLAGLGARLLVVGRGPGNALAELGPDVRYARVDIADADALEAAVADAEQAWGAELSGVLHLAGHYELTTIADTPPARWRAQALAKVDGSLSVARVLAHRPGSRLVAFSSLLSVLPVVGSSAYVAGNRFLEALCAHLAPHTETRCLVWGLWRGVGINAAHEYSEAANRGRLLAFSAAQGRSLLTAALHQPPGTLLLGVDPAAEQARGMVSPARQLEAVRAPARDVFGIELPVGTGSAPAPGPAVVVGADRLGVARTVRDVLRRVAPGGIGAEQPFYEAGIGSVQLLRLHTLLQEALGTEFPQTTLFTHPTEAALVRYLTDLVEPATDGPRVHSGRDRRVAIIGMAARFPGADTLDEFWANVLGATVSTRRFGRAELLAAGLPESLVDHPDFVPVSGALDDIAGFDADLFGISAGEAALTDPQQRLFLQVCHEALEHAGRLGTTGRVGVYAGSGMNLYSLRTYLREHLAAADPGDQLEALRVTIGNEADFLATRVAYKLGLTGPALAVRSACSTSLVAVHLAVQALLTGEADLALAGAAALHVPRVAGYRYQDGSILSRTGRCRAFDASADGTVGGNGVAAVLLKPLEAALADGDTVHAVIVGSAVNNDGSDKVGYTSPSVSGQVRVIREALAAGNIDPATVGYLEAHGTGTRLGDPIEVEALRQVFGARTEPLPLGSVKANIGHLDSCAGMAGLIKTVLALRAGVVPPLAGLRSPNPELRLGPLELPTARRDWPVAGVRRAGVSALGVGGTNAHVVLEEPPPVPDAAPTPVSLVPLSARGPEALGELTARTAAALASGSSGADVLTTLGAGRRRLPHRVVAWGSTTAETAAALRGSVTFADDETVAALHGNGVVPHGESEPMADNGTAAALRGGDAVTGVMPTGGTESVTYDSTTADALRGGGAATGAIPTGRTEPVTYDSTTADALRGGGAVTGAIPTGGTEPAISDNATADPLRGGGAVTGVVPIGGPGPVVFAFAGQGVDCSGAAAGLLAHPAAAEVLHRCAERHRRIWGVDLLGPLLGEPHEWTTATVQPALLALQLAQAALLESVGVRPDVLIGHSVGEYAALCLAGALSEEDAMDLAAARGALMASRVGEGAMLAVFAESAEAPDLELAVRNGDRHVVLAGPVPAVTAAMAQLDRAGVDHRRLPVDRAFHTAAMDPVLDELAHQASTLDWRPLRLPVVTGLGGALLPPGTLLDADHVRRHTRETADFAAGIDHLTGEGATTFVELGPAATLTGLGRRWPDTTWIPLRRKGVDAVVPALGTLFCRGVEVGWTGLALAAGGRRVPLPTYPFQRTPHWAAPLPEGPQAMPADQQAVLDTVRALTARHLGEPPDRIPADVPFFDLGADSLLLINMVRELEVAFGVRVTMRELFEEVDTPERLSEVIVARMDPTRRADLAAGPPAEPRPAAAYGTAPTAGHLTPQPAAATAHSQPALPPGTAYPATATNHLVPPTQLAPNGSHPAPPNTTTYPAPVPSNSIGPAAPSAVDGPVDAIMRQQLELMGRFTQVMSDQLAALTARPAPPAEPPPPVPMSIPVPQPEPAPRPAEPEVTQLGPVAAVPRASGLAGGRLDERQRTHLDDLITRYTQRTARSKEIAQRYRRRLADSRAVVGFRGATKELLYPLAAERARGAYLEDVDGNTYVDITMGYGTLLFGHEPPFLTEAVATHLADGMRLGPRGEE